ncbi:hypothetical protein HME9302_01829 [Alteripontixanthobacter maritimus]|uniref:DUF2155 domain-containing protein n=1 Tax=Alteripontixanthobacter maritimus TaxID=2161824 RepID=A0A369QAQ6_9SPHN|nr:DUF2155 domain-containing protein [Alteripontixanthobacter maritimus]RDC60615.1 hypothetical protein HME9302_01829 [Alteripontixanthobacter maritimus]
MRTGGFSILALVCGLALAGCNSDAPDPQPRATEVPEDIARQNGAPATAVEQVEGATPMAERVATIGLINKRNNITQDFEMSPGDSVRSGDVIIRLSACERHAPWERPQQTGAFVQVLVNRSADSDDEWQRVFSGWLFKESPSVNVVEHPIYDVWVKDCAMSFPGEARPASPSDEADDDEDASANSEA